MSTVPHERHRLAFRRPAKETRHDDAGGSWYTLDNAGILMPSVSDAVVTNLFRFSATLDEDVDRDTLQDALDRVGRRFPYFMVELRRGLFWHSIVPRARPPLVEEDPESPMQAYDVNKRGHCLVRVLCRGRRVACEFHHSVADGTGGMRFLKNLLAEYARLRWPGRPEASVGPADSEDLYDLEARPPVEEYEDAYARYYSEGSPTPPKVPRAFRHGSLSLPRFRYRVTCGIVPLEEALAAAKKAGVSLTELLAACYLDTMQELWLSAPPWERKLTQLAISIPVNMRKLFPSTTNRNFSLFTFVTQDMRLGARDFPEILDRAHHQLRYETDAKTMGMQLSRNVAASKLLAFRLFPLPLKDLVFGLLYHRFGEDLYSGAISNLGAVSLPPALAARIERFDFVPSPTRGKANIGALSWKGKLHVSFGSLGSSREVERLFLTRLRRLGLHVKVECNLG